MGIEKRVAGYELRGAGYGLRVAGCVVRASGRNVWSDIYKIDPILKKHVTCNA